MQRRLHEAALLVVALLLFGCGGGGKASGAITPAPALRSDLLFGYYGQDSLTILETTPHANLVWPAEFYGVTEQIAALSFAQQAGARTVVQMPLCLTPLDRMESEATFYLDRLRKLGLLGNVVAVTWCDEPNTARSGNWTDADATAAMLAIRRAMASVDLKAKLAVIYACQGGRPGADEADWLSCDDYDSGCAVFARYYDSWALRQGQRFFAVIAGSDPHRLDPACAEARVHGDARFVALIAFAFQTVHDGRTYRGIRENGLRRLYCEAGMKAKTGSTAGC